MRRLWSFLQGKVLPLAIGETVWRLSMLAILALVSRRLSVAEFGAFNLGLVLYQYVGMLTDFGTRAIGSRLIAVGRYPASRVVASVGRKRLQLYLLAFSGAGLYLILTPGIPISLVVFAAAALFAAMSHDWVLWAQERYWRFAGWRLLLGLLALLLVAAAVWTGGGLAALALGYAIAVAGGMVCSWLLSSVPVRWPAQDGIETIDALRWREITLLGLALAANQFFQTGDVMLLGVLGSQQQLGIYSAASRLVLLLFGVYYLGAQALYPLLARQFADGVMTRKTVVSLLGGAALCGLGLTLVAFPFREGLVQLAFGREMVSAGAAGVLGLLVFVLPMELVMGTWGMMATAAGLNRLALKVTLFGALANAALNVWLIPSRGATGAALASLVSYGLVSGVILLTLANLATAEPAALKGS